MSNLGFYAGCTAKNSLKAAEGAHPANGSPAPVSIENCRWQYPHRDFTGSKSGQHCHKGYHLILTYLQERCKQWWKNSGQKPEKSKTNGFFRLLCGKACVLSILCSRLYAEQIRLQEEKRMLM